jgi:hypothetical protein
VVCSLGEDMTGSGSVVRTSVSSTKVPMVESWEVGRSAV